MSTEKQLAVQEPSVSMMLSAFIEKGITPDSVAAFSQLCALKERMDDKQAERDFAAAFAKMQGEMPKIEATKGVPNNDGTVRYKFAPFEEIMRLAQPVLIANGFAVTFDSKIEETRIVSICTLLHVSGHSRSNSFACRVGKGPPGSSESQSDGSASTYAKRFALCNALNIVIEHEQVGDDARGLGSPMDAERVVELKKRVAGIKADEAKFLTFAGGKDCKTFEAIPSERYEEIDAMLTRKEKATGLRNEDGSFNF